MDLAKFGFFAENMSKKLSTGGVLKKKKNQKEKRNKEEVIHNHIRPSHVLAAKAALCECLMWITSDWMANA